MWVVDDFLPQCSWCFFGTDDWVNFCGWFWWFCRKGVKPMYLGFHPRLFFNYSNSESPVSKEAMTKRFLLIFPEREREREYCFPCCLNNKFGFMNGSPKKVATFSSWVSAHAIHAWDRPTRRNRAAKTCSTQKRAATLDQPSLINLTVPDVCLGRFCMCSYLSRWYCIYDIDFVRYVLKNGEKEVCESFAPDF